MCNAWTTCASLYFGTAWQHSFEFRCSAVNAMASITKRKSPPFPLPAGLVICPPPPPPPPKRQKLETGEAHPATTAKSSSSHQKWDPEAQDKPKAKHWWEKGKAGKKKKLRAMKHWVDLNHANFAKMDKNDFVDNDKNGLKEWEFPAHEFRKHARKWEILRYFSFLLQMVIKFVKVWHPTRAQKKHYGLGCHTAARIALTMMHTGPLPRESVLQLRSIKRVLWGRVASDSENLKVFESESRKEAENDKSMTVAFLIRDHIKDVLIPLVKDGTFPMVNPNRPILPQYQEVWEECEYMLPQGLIACSQKNVHKFVQAHCNDHSSAEQPGCQGCFVSFNCNVMCSFYYIQCDIVQI